MQPAPPEWKDFDAASRRSFEEHIRNSFVFIYKPVLDDAGYPSWESTAEYRQWCKENLPEWLGYNRD